MANERPRTGPGEGQAAAAARAEAVPARRLLRRSSSSRARRSPGPMQVPRLEKIVVNMGVGEAVRDSKVLDSAVEDLAIITGQKPGRSRRPASRSPAFKLREGMSIGAKVTLRGARMWEFLDRLLSTALPRIRDFRGLNPNAFDGHGQLLDRRDRAADLPGDRLRQGRVGPGHGHHDRDHGAGPTTRGGRCCARWGSRSPGDGRGVGERRSVRRRTERWRRKHWSNKQQGAAEVRRARLHAMPAVRASAGRVPRFLLCRICFRELAHAGEMPGVTKASW